MEKNARLTVALRRLRQQEEAKHLLQIPNYRQELGTDFRFLCFIILTQKTTDERAFEVAKKLFEVYPTIKSIYLAQTMQIAEIIKPAGLQKAKASSIKDLANILLREKRGKVPSTYNELVKLPHVGAKTANIVLHDCFGYATFPVDTHILRVTSRLIGEKPTPQRCEKLLKESTYPSFWFLSHSLLIQHGRTICQAKSIQCSKCPLTDVCAYHSKYRVSARKERR